jgi:hypothetical protein
MHVDPVRLALDRILELATNPASDPSLEFLEMLISIVCLFDYLCSYEVR